MVFGLTDSTPAVISRDPLHQLVAVARALRDEVQHEQRQHLAPAQAAGERVLGPAPGRRLRARPARRPRA